MISTKKPDGQEITSRTCTEKLVMNTREAANYLRVSSKTLLRYRNRGLLKFYRIGGIVRYRISDLSDFLESNAVFTFIEKGGRDAA